MQQAIAPGTVLNKRYQIQKKIPDTTSNQCYLAEDTDQSNRLVVISFPRMELLTLPSFTTAFEDACQRLMKARLNGIVKTLDCGEYDSQPYSVLQYITHETLESSLTSRKNNHKKVPVDEVLDWARPLAVTLDELHGLGYVHSNVRPTQVFLGQKRQVLLGDFVTEFTLQRLGTFKQAIASLDIADHLAPEYIKSNYNESYDQYLLATIIYQALAGRAHFHNPGSTEAYRRQVATKFPEPLLSHRPELVGASRILGKALERNPVKRFDSCREFVNELGSAQVNPVFANNDDKPVVVIKKVIDETVPDTDPIITSIRTNNGSRRKKGLAWLGVLLVGLGVGAYAINHLGGVGQFKTKITAVLSNYFSEDSAPDTKKTNVIVPISGNLASSAGSQSSSENNSTSSGSDASETSNPASRDTEQNNDSVDKTSAVAITPVTPQAIQTETSGIIDKHTNDDAATTHVESLGEQVVVDDVIKSKSAKDPSIASSTGSEIDETDLLAVLNLSLTEGEAEFRKSKSETNQSVKEAATTARLSEVAINEAISLTLQEAQLDFMQQASPAKTPQGVESVVDQSSEIANHTVKNAAKKHTPLTSSDVEFNSLNSQLLAATRLADEQSAASKLIAEEKMRQREVRLAREAAKKKADEAAKKKADEDARKKAEEVAKKKAEVKAEKKAEDDASPNAVVETAINEIIQDEFLSAPVAKSFDEMQKERARIQALKAKKMARINGITKDCVTSGKIHREVIGGNLPYVKSCLSVGVDPNSMQSNRRTLLHQAALGGYLNIVKLLLAKGAQINAKSTDGKTPLDMAIEQKQTRMISYLRSRGGVTTR